MSLLECKTRAAKFISRLKERIASEAISLFPIDRVNRQGGAALRMDQQQRGVERGGVYVIN